VSDVFAPEIHENIAAVTHHLRQRGLVTFELVPTKEGALCAEFGLHGRWRLLTHLDGISFEEVQSRAQARSAAELIGRFHAALDDFEAPLAPMGIPFRNTALYLARMDRALDEHAGHRLGEPVRGIAQQIHTGFERLGPPMAAPERVIHGDLKLANILFEGSEPPARDRALALIDFDTLMRAPLWSEWGDAWRSWCAVGGDENEERSFDLAIFESSVEGFVAGYPRRLSTVERDSLVLATERIALELAARFATDALEESYFAWDEARYSAAGEHHLVRARGQLGLFEAAWACRSERAAILGAM
jgi:Ser/Thr protein kinase RdoA (MazF antagonist)